MYPSEVTRIPFQGPPDLAEWKTAAGWPEPDPLLLDFLRFAERKGRGVRARHWAADPASLAEARVFDAVAKAGNKRNAFRGLLRELARPTPFE